MFYILNPAAFVVTAGTFTVSSVEIVAAMITPDQSYLQEISNGLANGGTLKLPLQLYKSITSTLAPTPNQNIAINCGYLGSINTITLIEKTAALGPIKNGNDIQNFYILLDGQRYPLNKAITTGVEAYYQTLAAYNTSLISLTIPDASQSFAHYSFKTNQQFSSGNSSANGLIEIAVDCTGSIPAAGSTIETMISYDALLIVSRNSCSLVVDVKTNLI